MADEPRTASSHPPLRISSEIQGNVLAAFNKDLQAFLFLAFPDGGHGRRWLGDLEPLVASTKEVEDFNERFSAARRRIGHDPVELHAVWSNVTLTFRGLAQLARSETIKELPRRFAGISGRGSEASYSCR